MPTICWAEANALSQTSFLIEEGFFMLEMSTILYALVSFRLFSYLKMISAVFNYERGVYLMSRIGLLEDFNEGKVRETLNLLLRDRSNEFRELAEAIGIPRTAKDWEVIVLRFCLDFEDCFKIWTDDTEPDPLKERKCMTIMREIAKGKKHIHEIIHLQDIAYTLQTEFHQTYKRVS